WAGGRWSWGKDGARGLAQQARERLNSRESAETTNRTLPSPSPRPSPLGRGRPIPRFWKFSNVAGFSDSAAVLPLLAGEGWDEGERNRPAGERNQLSRIAKCSGAQIR